METKQLRLYTDNTEPSDTVNFPDSVSIMAVREREDRKRRRRLILLSFSIFFGLLIIFKFFFPISVVEGSSMYPTYKDGQIIFSTNRLFYPEIQNGYVVVFSNDGTKHENYIKRIVGTPGDTLQILQGDLYRNGKLAENFEYIVNVGMLAEPYTLKDGEYFAMGDNRNRSYDSRAIGPIDKQDIWCIVAQK